MGWGGSKDNTEVPIRVNKQHNQGVNAGNVNV